MNRNGFTLVEVIISALILALTAGGVLYIFSMEKGTVSETGHRVEAMEFARQSLEDLNKEIGADTWPGGALTAEVDVDTSASLPEGDFKDKFGATRKHRITDMDPDHSGDPDYKSVTVTVNWTEPQ